MMGVTIESAEYTYRIKDLVSTPAKTKFLSIEPLLSSIPELPLKGIDWVIVGGESGMNSRIIIADWVRGIKNKCVQTGVPFFFKQWGGVNKKKSGRLLDGRTWNETPIIMGKSI